MANIRIFDSHAHYDDESFNGEREQIIEQLKQNGVINILNCGASIEGARASVELANKYELFYAAVGIHPEHANIVDERIIQELKSMAANPKVRAIGEIGLDYYYDENPSKDIQIRAFREQMRLASELNLPVVIHDRDAHEDTLKIMKEFKDVTGVVHCFSGSVEFARECLKLGYYIGFTGVVTFKNARKIIEVARDMPLDRILVETDCPYMAPVPHRGKRNRSDYIRFILEQIAQIKGIGIEELSEMTIQNAKKLLNLK